MTDEALHTPVLLNEALAALNLTPAGIYIDATFGRGGHSLAMLRQLGPHGRVYAFDKDPEAVRHAHNMFADEPRFTIRHGSYVQLEQFARAWGIMAQVQGILMDLGVSSPQLDTPERGFSFRDAGPLDMRMDTTQGESAAAWLARADEADIAYVLKEYGEERYAKRIARAIVSARTQTPITTTRQLAEVVAAANPAWERHKDPSTRAFQGIRIFINNELADLDQALPQALNVLAPAGRLVVISFHSLEDRIVKNFMRDEARGDDLPPDFPIRAAELHANMRLVGKAIKPSAEEIRLNPRARSAVMRVAERLP